MSTNADVAQIGRYKYVRTLLQGQNSTVMEVVEDGTGKKYAMKELLPTIAEDPAERKVFEFEAKLGMELRHPNLIHVVQYVKDRKRPYFVMEYFPSTQMKLMLSKRDLHEEVKPRLHRIIAQSASGLAYMHDKGWVHRDIKPENLIVNKSGEVRLIDYALALKIKTGLSKMFASKPPCQGTHSYMSPEQIRCQPSAATADIYSFGVTCYEMACGRPPFRANSSTELLQKHLSEQPNPPIVHNKQLTTEFSELIMRMIKKKPAERLQSMHEFGTIFSRIRVFSSDPAPWVNG